MNNTLQDYDVSDTTIPSRQLVEGLHVAIENNYRQLFEVARNEWERNYAGSDPSDACVSVRIAPRPTNIGTSLVYGSFPANADAQSCFAPAMLEVA